MKRNLIRYLYIISLTMSTQSFSYELGEPEYDAGNKYIRVTCEDGSEGVAEYNGVNWFFIYENEIIICSDIDKTAQAICEKS